MAKQTLPETRTAIYGLLATSCSLIIAAQAMAFRSYVLILLIIMMCIIGLAAEYYLTLDQPVAGTNFSIVEHVTNFFSNKGTS